MLALCFVASLVLCFIVDRTFQNNWLTAGLAVLMGITSGFLTAADSRKEREGHGK